MNYATPSNNCAMLVREDHVAGERPCWWERIMLVGKDHVGGKESCWRRRIMLVGKDHVVVARWSIIAKV